MTDTCRCARIRALNDELRTKGAGGRIFVSAGLKARGEVFLAATIAAMRAFDAFTEENDPHEEHDFGCVEIGGQAVFWKIDYYDPDLKFGSENPADPAVTARVLTLMLAEEY